MSEAIKYQLELTRNNLLKEVKSIPQELLDVQPDGFNNTLHWHIGHVLTVTEQFIMNYPINTDHLSEKYLKLFGYGSKPSEWEGEIPSVDLLIDQLQDQISRITELPDDVFTQELPEVVLGQKTVGQLAMLSAYHEANHLGQIHAMKRIIEK